MIISIQQMHHLGITQTQQNLANEMRFFSMLATTCDLWKKKKEKAKATYFFFVMDPTLLEKILRKSTRTVFTGTELSNWNFNWIVSNQTDNREEKCEFHWWHSQLNNRIPVQPGNKTDNHIMVQSLWRTFFDMNFTVRMMNGNYTFYYGNSEQKNINIIKILFLPKTPGRFYIDRDCGPVNRHFRWVITFI